MKANRLITGLLTLLGFSACEPEGLVMYGPPPVPLMYGPANVGFVVKGTVTDADEKPVENIRVVLKLQDDDPVEGRYDRRVCRDTVYTDNKGEFKTGPRPYIPLPWTLIAADIDGAENGGEFETKEKPFTVERDNYDNDEQAYVNEINLTLTEKDESE